MSDFFVAFAGAIAAAAVVVCLIMVPVVLFASASCHSQGTNMGFETSFGLLQDCMIKVDGAWVLLDKYQTVRVRQ